MKDLMEQLKLCPASEFFPRLKEGCHIYGYSTYLISFSLSESTFFIAGEHEYLLLCVAFAKGDRERLIDKSRIALGEERQYFCPLTHLRKQRNKLMQICHGYGDSFRFYLGMAMEYALLNTEEERESWLQEGICLVKENVLLPDSGNNSASHGKTHQLANFLSCKNYNIMI